MCFHIWVVEAYRLDRYDNQFMILPEFASGVVEAYRLDRYDNLMESRPPLSEMCCRSLSFG